MEYYILPRNPWNYYGSFGRECYSIGQEFIIQHRRLIGKVYFLGIHGALWSSAIWCPYSYIRWIVINWHPDQEQFRYRKLSMESSIALFVEGGVPCPCFFGYNWDKRLIEYVAPRFYWMLICKFRMTCFCNFASI